MNSTKFEGADKGTPVWSSEVLPWSQVCNRNEPCPTFHYNVTE